MTRTRLFRAAFSASVAASALLATPVLAQTADGASAEDSGDIVVTARRREENLLDVPVAITAYSGDALERSGATDITAISDTTPNVTLENSRATNSTLSAFIRGVGQQDPVSGFEAGVGLYLDDVYLNRPQAAVLDVYDVERIEVLRGPQGTLYGRNTIGGAVKYVTKRLPDQFALKARATYGSYDQADGVLTMSAPIGGKLRVGGSLARLSRGGFGTNLTTGLENYNKDVWAGRGTIELGGSGDPVLIRLSGDYTRDKSNPRGGHRLVPSLLTATPVLADVYDTRGGLNNPKQDIKAYGLALNATAELSDTITVRSISAWREDTSYSPIDFDALPAVDVDVPGLYKNEQISQEFQLLYDADKLHGLVGFYYLDAKSSTAFDVLLSTTVAGLNAYTFGDVRTSTWSVFGDFTYDLTDQISLSAGGRYTSDERRSRILRQTKLGTSAEFGGTPITLATTSDFRGTATYKRFTPRASISFKPSRDHMVYASYSKGFKGGGFDPRGLSTAAPDANRDGVKSYQEIYDFLSFEPESVNSYELGWKAAVLDRRLRFALTGFYADYINVQIPGSAGFDSNGDGTNDTFIGVTTNAGKARMKGVEFESNFQLARDFAGAGSAINFTGTLGYIDAQYRVFIDAFGNDVAKLRAIQNTPKWTLSGTLDGSVALGGGLLRMASTYSYRSATRQFETPSPYLDQKGYGLWDASVSWTDESETYSLSLNAKNIANTHYKTSGYQFLAVNTAGTPLLSGAGNLQPTLGKEGIVSAFYGNPRQLSVSLGVKF